MARLVPGRPTVAVLRVLGVDDRLLQPADPDPLGTHGIASLVARGEAVVAGEGRFRLGGHPFEFARRLHLAGDRPWVRVAGVSDRDLRAAAFTQTSLGIIAAERGYLDVSRITLPASDWSLERAVLAYLAQAREVDPGGALIIDAIELTEAEAGSPRLVVGPVDDHGEVELVSGAIGDAPEDGEATRIHVDALDEIVTMFLDETGSTAPSRDGTTATDPTPAWNDDEFDLDGAAGR